MTDDLISRQAAIQWVKTECNPYGKPTLEFESGKKVIKHLEQMPSAEPQRYMVTMAESMDLDRLKGIITKPSDITLIPLPKAEPNDYQYGYNQGFINGVKYEQEKLSAEPRRRWIPVTERLPELYKDVLVWYVDDYNIACLVQIDNIKYWHFESSEMDSNIDNVTAWMPLPKPWKGEDNE